MKPGYSVKCLAIEISPSMVMLFLRDCRKNSQNGTPFGIQRLAEDEPKNQGVVLQEGNRRC